MFAWFHKIIRYFTEISDFNVYYQTTEKCDSCILRKGIQCGCMQDIIFPNSTRFKAERHSDKDRTCRGYMDSNGGIKDRVTLPRVIEPYN